MAQHKTPLRFTREEETQPDGRYVVYYSFAANAAASATQNEPLRAETTERSEEAGDV
ncbi:MAG: hypothetical protein H0V86_05625 [Chloroflexia bacterium]|nr:hypothetical protein [Chloroflexia bacterium]